MECEVPAIAVKRSLSVNEYQRVRSLSPDPRHLSPQPPSVDLDSEMSVHTVKAQPDHQYIDPVTGRRYTTPPSDHMLLSVLALLFCMMWPTIFCAALSVIYSFQVDVFWNLKEYQRAHTSSTSARNWAVASIICGCGIVLAVVFISALWVFANKNKNYS